MWLRLPLCLIAATIFTSAGCQAAPTSANRERPILASVHGADEYYITMFVEHGKDSGDEDGVFAVLAQANKIILSPARDGRGGEVPSVVVTGGWLYAVGNSPVVGTGTATASAPGSRLIVIVEGTGEEKVFKIVHPDSREVPGGVTKGESAVVSFLKDTPSFVLQDKTGALMEAKPLAQDASIQQLIDSAITPVRIRKNLP